MVETKKRILSIDALRGLDMIWLVGLASFFTVLNKAWPNAFTDLMAKQVTHTSVGIHLYDLMFPTFVFLAGCSWPFCPCMKPMWNPTFILVSGAIAAGLLALFYWIIDVKGFTAWCFPLRLGGMNAITIYVLCPFVSFAYIAHKLLCGVEKFAPSNWTEVIDKGGHVLIVFWFLYVLYKRNVFIRV